MFSLSIVLLALAPTLLASPVRRAANCSTTVPSSSQFTSNPYLTDPFHFFNGQPVQTKADWDCRRQEISLLLQNYELGILPPRPTGLTASYASGKLTITATNAGKTITFAPTVTLPTSGTKPYPAIIGVGGASIPIPAGVAYINFDNSGMAAQNDQSSRGQGLFFQLYGSDGGAGAMIAWAWGVSRIIDALEMTPSVGIDPTKIGVTGCSRNGKGAMVVGAFEPRIALTIPEESGSGGDACWRLSNGETKDGYQVQTASEIVTENVWFGTAFNNYANNVNILPFDHHLLAAMIAPRPMLAIENTAYTWLSPESGFGCMTAAKSVWTALGSPDTFGFTQDGGHSHCAFPADQQGDLTAYINTYLLNKPTQTGIFKSSEKFPSGTWINWSTPVLVDDGSAPGTTTSPPPTTTTTTTTHPVTTTTTTSSAPAATQTKYGQCGGQGWTGATVCAAGSTCTYSSAYYSQCL